MAGRKVDSTGRDVDVTTGGRRTNTTGGWVAPRPNDVYTPPANNRAPDVQIPDWAVETFAPAPIRQQPRPVQPVNPTIESRPVEEEQKQSRIPDMSFAKNKLPEKTAPAAEPAALDPSVQRVMTLDSHVMVDEAGETSPVQAGTAPAPAPARAAKPPAPEQQTEDTGARFVLGWDTHDPEQSAKLQEELKRIDPTGIAAATQRMAELPLTDHPTITPDEAQVRKEKDIAQARALREAAIARERTSKKEPQELIGIDQFSEVGISEALNAAVSYVDRMLSGTISPESVRGQSGRLLTSYPDNPALLLLRGFSELLSKDASITTAISKLQAAVVFMKERYSPPGVDLTQRLIDVIDNRLKKGNLLNAEKAFIARIDSDVRIHPQATSKDLGSGTDAMLKAENASAAAEVEDRKRDRPPIVSQQEGGSSTVRPTTPQAEVDAARDADKDAWASLDSQAPGAGGGSTGGPGGPTTGGTADAEPDDIDPRGADQRILIKALERLGFDYSQRVLGLAKLNEPEFYDQLTQGEKYALKRYNTPPKEKSSKPKEPPRSRIQQNIDEAVAENRKNLKWGFFRLKGDKPSETKKGDFVHSEEVNAAIKEFFETFGIKRTKANTRWIFIAFQIYRGLSVDREGKIFGEDHKELVITDEAFILALREMQENALKYNHPFAWSNKHYPLGGRERYPGITSLGVAKFFTSNQTADSLLLSNVEDFIAYSVQTFKDEINPRMKEMAQVDQQESMYDLVEAVLPELNVAYRPRDTNSRTSVTEQLLSTTDFAELSNDKNLLAENARDIEELAARATAYEDKRRDQGSLDRAPKTVRESIREIREDPSVVFRNLPDRGARFFDGIMRLFKINAVALVPGLIVTSPAEKVMGVQGQQWGMDLLRRSSGAPMPTEESMDLIKTKSVVAAIHELIKLLDTRGPYAVVDASDRGVDFTKEGLHQAREGVGGAIKGLLDLGYDIAFDMTTADWMKQEETAELFLEHLVYQLYITQTKRGGVTYTPEMIESNLRGDPISFLRDFAATPEGLQAIAFASQSSLGGTDWSTEALRQTLASRVKHAGVAALVSLFPKFGLRAPQSMFWGSMSFMYLTKKGIDKISLARGADPQQINDLNNIMLGGNDEFWFGLKQNWDVDVARMGVRAPIYLLALGILSVLGLGFGFEPPDDPKKRHLWYEWQIGGVAFKTNWFFTETLAFAMPTAIGVMAATKTGDIGLGVQIIHFGILEAMSDNPWLNPFDAIDFIASFDETIQTEKLKSEGYAGEEEISTIDFLKTQAYVWWLKRVVGGFDSGAWKAFRNDHGIFKGDQDLARSRHQINTGDPDNPIDSTTYADAQIRGVTMDSPAAAFWQNAVSGIAHDAVNGYRRDQMPLNSTSDPKQMMHFNEFSVFDTEGHLITDTSVWPAGKREEITNLVILEIEGRNPTELLNDGVVIPYWARDLAAAELYRLKAIPVADFKARDIAGEWTVDFTGMSWDEGNRLMQKAKAGRQAAKDAAYAEQALIDKKLDILFDDTVPYGAQKYNIKEQTYEAVYTWKEDGWGGPLTRAGMPATKSDYLLFRDKVDFQLYPYGDEKSGISPIATVDNPNNTYDAQTPLTWQKPDSFVVNPDGTKTMIPGTDNAKVLADIDGYIIQTGRNKGVPIADLITGAGAIGIEDTGMSWDEMTFVIGSRGLVPVKEKFKKLERADYKELADAAKWVPYETPAAASDGTRFYGGGGGGGGSYSPSIYSHPAYSLNPDKPQGLYSKIPTFTRFDYLRPTVATKGSREAYRRLDF